MAKKPVARSVESLKVLLAQINKLAPNRSKASDGWIGDAKHMARHSDHNPEPDGTVDARDFTNDPSGGCDMAKVCDAIAASKDKRVSYMICNGRIMSGRKGPKPWIWRKYSGANGHYHHAHVSVLDEGQDDKTPWKIEAAFAKPKARAPGVVAAEKLSAALRDGAADLTVKQVNSVMKLGSKGEYVEELQRNLNRLGYGPLNVDGDFGGDTKKAVEAFQRAKGLKLIDGWAGPRTLKAIGEELSKEKLQPKIEEAEAKVAATETVVNDAASGGSFSKTEIIGAITGVTGTATVAKEGVDAVRQSTASFMDLVATVGPWVLLAVVLAGGAAFIIYDRRRKRLEAQAVKKVL